MSDAWLTGSNTGFNRILDSVGGDAARALQIDTAMRNGRIEKWFVHVDPSGLTSIFLLDANGKKIPTPVSRVVAPRPPGD
jgi:filamentous hemagglutinin